MLLAALFGFGQPALALTLEGEVPGDGPDHILVPFEVPAGTEEIRVVFSDQSEVNILDWGLDDAAGHRGWSGGNTDQVVVGVSAASDGYLPGPIAGQWSLVIGKAKVVEPAHYVATITFEEQPTLQRPAEEPYQPWVIERPPGWMAGDFHVHSDQSGDANADFDAIAQAAREAGLDFVVLSDHNTISAVGKLAAAQRANPDILLIPGIEVTTYQGHFNAIGATEWVDHRVSDQVDFSTMAEQTHAQQQTGHPALVSINHPTLALDACIGCAWDLSAPGDVSQRVDAIEVVSSLGLFTAQSIDVWQDWCAVQDRCPAVLGGSDDHKAGIGLGTFDAPVGTPTTWVYAQELSAAGVLRGVADAQTFVTMGRDDLSLDVSASTLTIGGQQPAQLRWFFEGEPRQVSQMEGPQWEASVDGLEEPGDWRVEVWEGQTMVAITSAFALSDEDSQPTPETADDCGCQSGPASTPAAFVMLMCLFRGRRWR